MSIPIISTKLYIPPLRTSLVTRPRLIERLNEGAKRKLTLISAAAGYGKTTLVSEWLAAYPQPTAWLSLDEGDNDLARFLNYLIVALREVAPNIGEGVVGWLQSPQLPPPEAMITALINEMMVISDSFVLVLDDYHVITSDQVKDSVAFLLEHTPPQLHLVLTTREDPHLPLSRLRVRNQLIEVRASDLRFTSSEAAEFLSQVMELHLSSDHVALLLSRTEGWAAGLQLAALCMQGQGNPDSIIHSFSGGHPFVLDYLIEEVLQKQPERIQHFLLHTSILDRMCGTLCDAVLDRGVQEQQIIAESGQETLAYLERANLFIVPLDNERKWYRYHHLFADLLRRRLVAQSSASEEGDPDRGVAVYHRRASRWYEDQGFAIEAFHHATAAGDTRLAAHLLEGGGMPLIFRGAVAPVLHWLSGLPRATLDAIPSLWVMYAASLLLVGQTLGVEQKLQAAEQALQGIVQDEKTLDLIGHIASIRATLAVSKHEADMIMAESLRALKYLHPTNLPVRTATTWALGYAYQLQGDRSAASNAYAEALANSQMIGHVMITMMSTLGLGMIQEAENQLAAAAETYQRVLKLAGDPPMPVACEAHLGFARICYAWNDLQAAMQHGRLSVQLAKQFEQTDRAIAGEVFLASVKLAQGEVGSAAAMLAKAEHITRQQHFENMLPQIADLYVRAQLQQGNLAAAAHQAQQLELHICQARVSLAQGDPRAALGILELLHEQAVAKGLADERLKVMILRAITLHALGDKVTAVQQLVDALTMAEPGGFIRAFVDEGMPMYPLLCEVAERGMMLDYVSKLLAAFEPEESQIEIVKLQHRTIPPQQLIEPLSARELEVLRHIAQGLSNREISERLFIALTTVKGHNRIIFDKLQVKRRTEAVARARKLGLL
ncbi:LuxR C-terminal-related transcriptional regulator [Paenibacillus terrigena]|uniref:LuxR C-terminal-related transcriptional regulator n=1 Tax=Paenibacillus terrigena TaxID=369333 RepID=UPI00036B2F72|nr:LuxR C-terminal-related transcriptional regulator [Paenibacillus terrigena]